MILHRWTLLAHILISAAACHAADTRNPATQPVRIDTQSAIEYRGDINEKTPIGLTLRFNKDGSAATGTYFYAKYCEDIRIDAKIQGRSISIREFDKNGKQTGQFVGEFATVDPRNHHSSNGDLQTEVVIGEWSRPDGTKKQKFYLSAEFYAKWVDPECRYRVAGFDDDTKVNAFVKRFRDAVLDADSKRVAEMIAYPVKVTIDGKLISINDAKELEARFKSIFTEKYVEKIRNSPPCHLFSRDQGVMLGNGQVWVAPVKENGRTEPKVIAVNS
jgi:hypothetical protein